METTVVLNLSNINFYKGEKGASVTFYSLESFDGFEKNKNGVFEAQKVNKFSMFLNTFIQQLSKLSKVEMDVFDDLSFALSVEKSRLDTEMLARIFYRSQITVNRSLVKKGDVVDGVAAARDYYTTTIADIKLGARGKAKLEELCK